MHNIFSMGGYGLYVWTAYGITLTVLTINVLISFFEKKRVKKFLENFYE